MYRYTQSRNVYMATHQTRRSIQIPIKLYYTCVMRTNKIPLNTHTQTNIMMKLENSILISQTFFPLSIMFVQHRQLLVYLHIILINGTLGKLETKFYNTQSKLGPLFDLIFYREIIKFFSPNRMNEICKLFVPLNQLYFNGSMRYVGMSF